MRALRLFCGRSAFPPPTKILDATVDSSGLILRKGLSRLGKGPSPMRQKTAGKIDLL